MLTHQLQQAGIAPSTSSTLSHDSLMQPQPMMNMNVAPILSNVPQTQSIQGVPQQNPMVSNLPIMPLPAYPYLNPMQTAQVPNMMNSTMQVSGQQLPPQQFYPVVQQVQQTQQIPQNVAQPIPIPTQGIPLSNQSVLPNAQQQASAPPVTSQIPIQTMYDINAQKPPLPHPPTVMGSSPVDTPPLKKQKQNPPTVTPHEREEEWAVSDNLKLSEAVEEFGHNWSEITQKYFPAKTAEQVEQHWVSIQPRKGKWSKEEDQKLLAAYEQIIAQDKANGIVTNTTQTLFWYKLAAFIPGRSGQQCLARYSETLDPTVK
jgi:hypothetical protein